MIFKVVSLSDINFSDHTYRAGNKQNISSITESIRQIGLINPPSLVETKNGYRVITGWKRLLALLDLGMMDVNASVFGADELPHSDYLAISYHDNKDRMDDIELSEMVFLYKHLCAYTDRDIIDIVLPVLEIPRNRKHLDRVSGLASLHKDIKDAFYNGRITIEQAQLLSELSDSTHGNILLVRILLPFKLNTNESKQVIKDIEEITLRDKHKLTDFIDELVLRVGDNGTKNDLRLEIKNMRYPALTKAQRQYDIALRDLNLPDGVKIAVNQFFEANDIEIRMKVSSSDELLQILSKLSDACDAGDIDRLIRIVREGE